MKKLFKSATATMVRSTLAGAALGLLIALILIGFVEAVLAAPIESTGCFDGLPDPPLVVVLPDGTEIAAEGVRYEVDARRLVVIREAIFCNGMETP